MLDTNHSAVDSHLVVKSSMKTSGTVRLLFMGKTRTLDRAQTQRAWPSTDLSIGNHGCTLRTEPTSGRCVRIAGARGASSTFLSICGVFAICCCVWSRILRCICNGSLTMRGAAAIWFLLLILLSVHSPPTVDSARLDSSLAGQIFVSSGSYLLSKQSRAASRSIDLGLTDAQLAVEDPLRNPSIHTVFARDSVFGRSSVAKKYTPKQKLATFDPDRARQLAQLNSIAYCENLQGVADWNCTRCSQIPGFQTYLVHFDESWDLLGYIGYWPALNTKVLAFRGTDSSSWYNWAENMRAWRTDATYPVPGAPKALRIHSGFLILWNSSSLASTFHEAFAHLLHQHPTGPTYVIGHSMGGALAQLAALDIAVMFGVKDIKVYTFGAPRVGNNVFEEFFASMVTESWRFTHGRDIVPSVPPQLFGFHHVSREVWLLDVAGDDGVVEERIIVCDDSGEDPTCHNSACRLGLCTSVADHLLYLGAHMYRGGEC